MKVVLGVPWYLPTSIGGTEVYVAGLAEELQKLGLECVVAVPARDGKTAASTYRNVRTVHYPGPYLDGPSINILDSVSAAKFRDWLALEQPDIYHQHDWTLNCGLTHLEAAKSLGITTFMTIHLAKIICITSTMLYEDRTQCDGQIIEERCARCFMKARGVPSRLAAPLAQMPTSLSAGLARVASVGRVFSGRRRAERALTGLKCLADAADCIVTVSQWLRDAILINGIAEEKVAFVRSAVDLEVAASAAPTARTPNDMLRIGFIGRWLEAKGLHVLIAALERLPKSVQFQLKVLGQSGSDKLSVAYRERIQKRVAGQPQYQFLTDQPRSAINHFYNNIDVLAVPSQLLESGPLVAFEANAWKVPVIGSDLGGLREIVRHQVDGLLVPHADVDAWTNAIRQLAQDPMLLPRLRNNIPPVRTMRDTASDMVDLYSMQLNRRRRVAAECVHS